MNKNILTALVSNGNKYTFEKEVTSISVWIKGPDPPINDKSVADLLKQIKKLGKMRIIYL